MMNKKSTTELFIKLLKAPSITPDDGGLMDLITKELPQFKAVRIDVNGVKNLLLSRSWGDGVHLAFAGHVDVVPPGTGWESEPFAPTIKGDKIFARGAQDMKSGVCAFVRACQDIEHFDGTLSIILTSDEEGPAKYGTLEVLRYLKERNNLPDFAIVAEPTCEEEFGDAIKIGRRGSINGVLEVEGIQGHAAYPQKSLNPLHVMAPRLGKLAGYYFDDGDEFFAPSQLVLTDLRSGMEVTNVTPGSLKLMFNVRNSTLTNRQKIENYIANVMEGVSYKLHLDESAIPFKASSNAPIVLALEDAIKKVTTITPKHSTAGGTSDARYLAQYGVQTIEFGVRNDTIHAPNEYTSLEDVSSLASIFHHVITNLKEYL
jgi:succinyl-diaminopimelate desuccinylase